MPGCARATLPYRPEPPPRGARVSADYAVVGDRLRIEIDTDQHLVEIATGHDLERGFAAIRDVRPDALFCGGDPVTMPLRAKIAEFALRQ